MHFEDRWHLSKWTSYTVSIRGDRDRERIKVVFVHSLSATFKCRAPNLAMVCTCEVIFHSLHSWGHQISWAYQKKNKPVFFFFYHPADAPRSMWTPSILKCPVQMCRFHMTTCVIQPANWNAKYKYGLCGWKLMGGLERLWPSIDKNEHKSRCKSLKSGWRFSFQRSRQRQCF